MAKLPRVPAPANLDRVNRSIDDLGTKLSNVFKDWSDHMEDAADGAEDVVHRLDKMAEAAAKAGGYTASQAKEVKKLNRELERTTSAWQQIAKFAGGQAFRAFDQFGKTLLSAGFSFFEKGLSSLFDALDKVYELTERWTRSMGEFKNRLGVTTKNIGQLGSVAKEVEGKIYGLTGVFGQGIPMVNEFVEGLGRVEDVADPKNLKELIRQGTLVSRVLGLSAQETGELTRTLQQLGEDTSEQSKLFRGISSGAKAAGVSTAKFGKDVVGSRELMASFGKKGREVFMGLVTYANRLGVSMKSFEAFTDMSDTFDSTTESMAKLNTVFGTTINSLDLVLEDDPAKRLETVRQALLGQGKTYESLSRQERNFLAQTMKVTDEELAGVLSTGKSLDDVRKDSERASKEQALSQKNMAKLINGTSATLFPFAQAFDGLTVKVTKLIRPFTDMLGLTKAGGKDAKSFGQVMTSVFKQIGDLIDRTAANKDFQRFMRDMAEETKKFFSWVMKVAKSGELQDWIKRAVKGVRDFYEGAKALGTKLYDLFTSGPVKSAFSFVLDHIQGLIVAWASLRMAVGGAKTLSVFSKGLNALRDLRNMAPGAPGGPASSMGPQPVSTAGKALRVAGGVAAVAATGAAGYEMGNLVNEAFSAIRSDKRSFSDLVADLFGKPSARKAEDQKGEDWQKKYEALASKAHAPSASADDRAALQKFLGVNDELQKRWAKSSEQQQKRQAETEAVVQQHLKGRIKNEDVFDRDMFQLKLRDYIRDKALAAGYQGDIAEDFDRLMSNGGEAMLNTAKGTRQFIDVLQKRFGITTSTPVPQAATRMPVTGGAGSAALAAGTPSRGASAGPGTTVVAGDVYLDGAKVGRHVVRHLVTREH